MDLMHSCRRVAELTSQSHDEPLGLLDRLRLRLHLSMCGNCRTVEQQLGAVSRLALELFEEAVEAETLMRPPAQRS